MRKQTLLGLFLLATGLLNAQTETLFGGTNRIGGFGGPNFQFATFNSDFAYYSGGGGGIIVNGQFFIGGFGMSLQSDHLVTIDQEDYTVDFGYGGLWLGYVHNANKLVHYTISLPIGGGGIGFEQVDSDEFIPDDDVLVMNPNLGIELNLTSWMKLNASAGYQFVRGQNTTYISSEALNTPTINIGLKFGYFAE